MQRLRDLLDADDPAVAELARLASSVATLDPPAGAQDRVRAAIAQRAQSRLRWTPAMVALLLLIALSVAIIDVRQLPFPQAPSATRQQAPELRAQGAASDVARETASPPMPSVLPTVRPAESVPPDAGLAQTPSPAAPPLTFEWAQIRILSVPSGADVKDPTSGKVIGHTPFSFRVKPSRTAHQFELHHKGFLDAVVEIVPEREKIEYTEKLERGTGPSPQPVPRLAALHGEITARVRTDPAFALASPAETDLVYGAMRALHGNHDPQAAIRQLETYRRRFPTGRLTEAVLGLTVEALLARDASAALTMATEYLRRFPQGRLRDEVVRVLNCLLYSDGASCASDRPGDDAWDKMPNRK